MDKKRDIKVLLELSLMFLIFAIIALIIVFAIPTIIGAGYYFSQYKKYQEYPIDKYQQLEEMANDILTDNINAINLGESYDISITFDEKNNTYVFNLREGHEQDENSIKEPQLEITVHLSQDFNIVSTEYYSENEYDKYIKDVLLSNMHNIVTYAAYIEFALFALCIFVIVLFISQKDLKKTMKIVKEHL